MHRNHPTPAIVSRCRRAAVAAAAALGIAGTGLIVGAAPALASTTSPSIANAVLSQLNAERKANHLAPLTMNADLVKSAHAHDLDMAKYNEMSHQLPNEAPFYTRITDAGYHWSWCGENIAWNSNETQAGALQLQTMMYDEKPPNDSHRLNILSTNFTNVGIDVYIDTVHGKLWMTEDFGRPS